MKYLLFVPQGGLNDCLTNLNKVLRFSKQIGRVLLLEMTNSIYQINFSDFFDLKDDYLITDSKKIVEIINKKSVYPKVDLKLFFEKKIKLKYVPGKQDFSANGILLSLPPKDVPEEIIFHSCCGGGNGFKMFKRISLKPLVKELCYKRVSLLNKYLCIQVRHTDYQCNYEKLYQENKKLIHSYQNIYLATDNEKVVSFFKSKKLNISCFTTFSNNSYNLHTSNVDPVIKICDLLSDIFIATNSEKLLSNSKGGFIRLLKQCFEQKKLILKKIK